MRFTHLFLPIVLLLYFAPFILAQDVTTLSHGGAVQSVAFSPVDNSIVASAGGHDTIKLWDLRRNTVKTLRGHKDTVNSVAFSPDGGLLVSGSADSTIKIWEVAQWENVGTRRPITVRISSAVHTVVFHPEISLYS